jgi:hypothetical protein
MTFDEVEAATRLGVPGERFESIVQYRLDDVYWVRIGSGEKHLGRPVIVENGHVVAEKSLAAGIAWLRRVARSRKPLPTASDEQFAVAIVPQVLMWYDALPNGWNESDSTSIDPQTNERGSVQLNPIEIKLVSPVYRPPRARNAPGLPGGGPPGGLGGPPGGVGPHRPSRATLREVDGKLTWIVESYDPHLKAWQEDLREKAEP